MPKKWRTSLCLTFFRVFTELKKKSKKSTRQKILRNNKLTYAKKLEIFEQNGVHFKIAKNKMLQTSVKVTITLNTRRKKKWEETHRAC